MKTLHLTIVFLACLIIAPLCKAEVEYPEEIAARLQQKYDSLTSLSFHFQQQSRGQMSGRPKRGSGSAVFHKDGEISRMRWDYNEPDKQILLSDGDTFFMYFAELRQMIVTPAETLDNDLTYSFFSGRGKISEKFHILPPAPEYMQEQKEDVPQAIKLIPIEEHSQVQHVHLWVSSDSLIRRIEIRDHFDTITLLNFNTIEEDPLADSKPEEIDERFSFTPPPGTEIVRQ